MISLNIFGLFPTLLSVIFHCTGFLNFFWKQWNHKSNWIIYNWTYYPPTHTPSTKTKHTTNQTLSDSDIHNFFRFFRTFQVFSLRSLNLEWVLIILLMFWIISLSLSLQLWLGCMNTLAAAGSCKTWYYLFLYFYWSFSFTFFGLFPTLLSVIFLLIFRSFSNTPVKTVSSLQKVEIYKRFLLFYD